MNQQSVACMMLSAGLALAAASGTARADVVSWANWTAQPTTTSAVGDIGGVSISYSGEILFTQLNNTGTPYWASGNPFTSPTVSNAPGTSDIIALVGGTTQINTLSFGAPVTNPVMAILSLGQPGLPVTYEFNAPLTLLSSGEGHFGGGNPSLFQDTATSIRGLEGHGTIQFIGTFTSISWTVPQPENWHGFTVGLVPTPSAALAIATAGVVALRRRR